MKHRQAICQLPRWLTTHQGLSMILVALLISSSWATAMAQPGLRPLQHADMPPGQVAQQQLLRRPAMVGYFQPVAITVPGDAEVAIWEGGAFQPLGRGTVTVGLLVGHVYRLKITHIPDFHGHEVFPSIEVINRLYAPPGLEVHFPVPVHLPIADLVPAMRGDLVTRVIYLEDPERAVAAEQVPSDQPYFDVEPWSDPLQMAIAMGRPMAIVRSGSRLPEQHEIQHFGFGTAPVLRIQVPPRRVDDEQEQLSNNR